MNSDITFGHSRVQKMDPKRAKGYPHTFSKKEYNDNSKGGVLMVEIREDDYYNSRRYEISGSCYFDNRRAYLFDGSHQQLALAVNKKDLS